MKKKLFDSWLVIIFFFLVSLGIILVYSATYSFSLTKTGDPNYLFTRHLIGVGIGLALAVAFIFIPIEKIRRYIPLVVLLTIIMLLLALLPGIGRKIGGANRWVNFGFFVFQPSELAKIVVVLYLASVLEKKQLYMKDYLRGTFPPLFLCVVIAGIILFQKDFSTAVFILLVVYVILYVGGARFIHLMLSLIAAIPILAPFVLNSVYRLDRIRMLINLESDPQASYQLFQSLEAFKRGGFFSLDFGKGLKTIPYIFNDFIYSVAGEEMGFMGALFIMALFLFLWLRGLNIAHSYPEKSFPSTLAFGLSFILVAQAIMNMAVTMALIFPTGITLPFLSYGRSSFLISCIAMGLLIQLSRGRQNLLSSASGMGKA